MTPDLPAIPSIESVLFMTALTALAEGEHVEIDPEVERALEDFLRWRRARARA